MNSSIMNESQLKKEVESNFDSANSLFWEISSLEMKWQVIRHKIQKTRMIYLLTVGEKSNATKFPNTRKLGRYDGNLVAMAETWSL